MSTIIENGLMSKQVSNELVEKLDYIKENVNNIVNYEIEKSRILINISENNKDQYSQMILDNDTEHISILHRFIYEQLNKYDIRYIKLRLPFDKNPGFFIQEKKQQTYYKSITSILYGKSYLKKYNDLRKSQIHISHTRCKYIFDKLFDVKSQSEDSCNQLQKEIDQLSKTDKERSLVGLDNSIKDQKQLRDSQDRVQLIDTLDYIQNEIQSIQKYEIKDDRILIHIYYNKNKKNHIIILDNNLKHVLTINNFINQYRNKIKNIYIPKHGPATIHIYNKDYTQYKQKSLQYLLHGLVTPNNINDLREKEVFPVYQQQIKKTTQNNPKLVKEIIHVKDQLPEVDKQSSEVDKQSLDGCRQSKNGCSRSSGVVKYLLEVDKQKSVRTINQIKVLTENLEYIRSKIVNMLSYDIRKEGIEILKNDKYAESIFIDDEHVQDLMNFVNYYKEYNIKIRTDDIGCSFILNKRGNQKREVIPIGKILYGQVWIREINDYRKSHIMSFSNHGKLVLNPVVVSEIQKEVVPKKLVIDKEIPNKNNEDKKINKEKQLINKKETFRNILEVNNKSLVADIKKEGIEISDSVKEYIKRVNNYVLTGFDRNCQIEQQNLTQLDDKIKYLDEKVHWIVNKLSQKPWFDRIVDKIVNKFRKV